MASKTGIASLGPYAVRVQSGLLIVPNDVAQKIENMVPLEEGTLRSIVGPCALFDQRMVEDEDIPEVADPGEVQSNEPPLEVEPGFFAVSLPAKASSVAPPTRPVSTDTLDDIYPGTSHFPTTYGEQMHGLYHCLLQDNERDVLLLHTGDEIWEFAGWQRSWRRLVSDQITATDFGYSMSIPSTDQPQFPTQFECTGNGVVIVPQNSRPLFYDGQRVGPLGFERRPAPPTGRGPTNSKYNPSHRGVGINDDGYCHDSTPWDGDQVNYRAGSSKGFGPCRIGTVSGIQYDTEAFYQTLAGDGSAEDSLVGAGWLLGGEWRCKVQFIDQFGNLSALSEASDGVTVSYQPTIIPEASSGSAPGNSQVMALELMKKQLAWVGIPQGPEECVGRVLYRTKDLINSGDGKFYYLPLDTSSVIGAYATLPDNVSTIYPDNIADGALVVAAENIAPAPRFKLCCVAFGRLWVANTDEDANVVQASLPGRWGTFDRDMKLYPDPTSEATGLHRCDQGLLAFTLKGTFLIQASDDGSRFRSSPVSSEVGCAAPSSIASLPDGRVVWLGYDGFYSYDGSSLAYLSGSIRKEMRRITRTRMKQACAAYDPRTGEYRCWVSINGSAKNNMCFIYDGKGWRTRTDVKVKAVCTTRDHRNLMLVAGDARRDSGRVGVYALDRSHNKADRGLTNLIDARTAVIETNWMTAQDSIGRKTTRVVYLWLRETENTELTIEVMRDWRNEVIETVKADRYSSADVPSFWGKAKLNEKGAAFVTRRPYWTRAQVYVPSNEVFKFRIKGSGFWEFVGLQVDVAPKDYGGAQVPP